MVGVIRGGNWQGIHEVIKLGVVHTAYSEGG